MAEPKLKGTLRQVSQVKHPQSEPAQRVFLYEVGTKKYEISGGPLDGYAILDMQEVRRVKKLDIDSDEYKQAVVDGPYMKQEDRNIMALFSTPQDAAAFIDKKDAKK